MSSRIVQLLHEAERVLELMEKRLEGPHDDFLEQVAGDLGKLLFEILPDCESRSDFSPIGIGRAGNQYTKYRASYGVVGVIYLASPSFVYVKSLDLPRTFLEQAERKVA